MYSTPLAHTPTPTPPTQATPDLQELITELSDRTESGYLFGGLASSRAAAVHLADGVWQGGLSGVAFTREVALISRSPTPG